MNLHVTPTWNKRRLSDLADDVRQLYEPKRTETLPYIGLEHIDQYTLRLKRIGSSSDTISTKKTFLSGDILFGTLRPYFRKVCKPKFMGVCSTDIAVIRTKNGNDSDFVFYLIANQPFIDLASNISSGTRMPRANWKTLSQSEWVIPIPPTQHKIAAILSAYDDLIENNTRRIKILEETAQLVYCEWFVNFRFPGHENINMVNSSLGSIPDGWKTVRTEQIVKRIPAGKLYEQKTVFPSGTVPVLDQGRSGIIGYHNDSPSFIASEEAPVIVFANHTCYQRLIQYPFSAIQNVLPFVPNPDRYRNIYWLHWATKGLVEFNDYKGHWPEFMSKTLLLPSEELCDYFGDTVKPIFKLIYKFERSNINLRETRDLLLPKLISGEIDVADLDIDIGEEPAWHRSYPTIILKMA